MWQRGLLRQGVAGSCCTLLLMHRGTGRAKRRMFGLHVGTGRWMCVCVCACVRACVCVCVCGGGRGYRAGVNCRSHMRGACRPLTPHCVHHGRHALKGALLATQRWRRLCDVPDSLALLYDVCF